MDHKVGVFGLMSSLHFESSGMGLDQPFGDGKAETDAGVACREKRIGGAGGHLGREAAAIIPHAQGKARAPVCPAFGNDGDGDPGRFAGRSPR